jgi:hypothetical protein
MSEKIRFYVGNDPHGYGGHEVSQEQADAYAKAIAAELGQTFPAAEIAIGVPDGFLPAGEQLKMAAWVQANWRRVRKEVNEARGWPEQFGGQKW